MDTSLPTPASSFDVDGLPDDLKYGVVQEMHPQSRFALSRTSRRWQEWSDRHAGVWRALEFGKACPGSSITVLGRIIDRYGHHVWNIAVHDDSFEYRLHAVPGESSGAPKERDVAALVRLLKDCQQLRILQLARPLPAYSINRVLHACPGIQRASLHYYHASSSRSGDWSIGGGQSSLADLVDLDVDGQPAGPALELSISGAPLLQRLRLVGWAPLLDELRLGDKSELQILETPMMLVSDSFDVCRQIREVCVRVAGSSDAGTLLPFVYGGFSPMPDLEKLSLNFDDQGHGGPEGCRLAIRSLVHRVGGKLRQFRLIGRIHEEIEEWASILDDVLGDIIGVHEPLDTVEEVMLNVWKPGVAPPDFSLDAVRRAFPHLRKVWLNRSEGMSDGAILAFAQQSVSLREISIMNADADGRQTSEWLAQALSGMDVCVRADDSARWDRY